MELFQGIIILMTFSVQAQSLLDLKKKLLLLQKSQPFYFPIDSNGFSSFKDYNFFSKQGDSIKNSIEGKNCHIVDFNKDGLKDIVYQNNEYYKEVNLFANKGSHFVETSTTRGYLVGIIQSKETTIYIKTDAIGCMNETALSELIVQNNGSVSESSISIHHKIKLQNSDTLFEQKIISGILRTEPVLNDKISKDSCTGENIKGNQVLSITNKEITIIRRQKNWLLVLCNEDNTSSIHWIKN